MEKPWLEQYPVGVPAEVDLPLRPSLSELLIDACQRFGERTAFCNLGARLTYAQLDHDSNALAAYLRTELGLQEGARVAIMMPNLLQYPVAVLAIARAGLVVVNINPQYTAPELAQQLRDSGAAAVIVLENFAHTLEVALPGTSVHHVIVTRLGDMLPALRGWAANVSLKYFQHAVPSARLARAITWSRALALGEITEYVPSQRCGDDLVFLQYTGGTTGTAKGAMLSHRNLVANVLQVGAWCAPCVREAAESVLIPLPLYHIYALTSCLVFASLGAQITLVTNPRDLRKLMALLAKTSPSVLVGIDTLYAAMLREPEFALIDFVRLKLATAGGMPLQRATAQRWLERTGVPLVEGYGLSETAPVVCSNPVDISEWNGSIGIPLPSTELAIVDDAGSAVAPGSMGELCVRGPQVMRGYWNNSEETARAFTADGWFRTGDLGFMDANGTFHITDRKKDMILVSGFNVYPNEVEDVVMLHPGVLEVAAVGTADVRSGERVKIFVFRKDTTLTSDALIAHCEQHLAAYKVPTSVEFCSEPLPKTPIGKVLRRALRTAPAPLAASA